MVFIGNAELARFLVRGSILPIETGAEESFGSIQRWDLRDRRTESAWFANWRIRGALNRYDP